MSPKPKDTEPPTDKDPDDAAPVYRRWDFMRDLRKVTRPLEDQPGEPPPR